MLDLLTASPCIEAYRVEPLSIAEIDAHPDSARIWATIRAMQGVVEDIREEAQEERVGFDDELEEASWSERRRCRSDLALAIKDIGDRLSEADRKILMDCLE